MFNQIIIIILCGIGGGILYCILFEPGFTKGGIIYIDNKKFYDPGSFGNVGVGIGTSLIIWGFGAADLPLCKMIAVCFLSATGGGSLITNMLRQYRLNSTQKNLDLEIFKTKTMNEISKNIIEKINKDKEENKNE